MKVKQLFTIIKGINKQLIEEVLYNVFCRPRTFPKLKNKKAQNKVLREKSVYFKTNGEFYDHIEMSGNYASAIVSYGTDGKNALKIFRHITFPSIRLRHDMTTASVCHNFIKSGEILVDGVEVKDETLDEVSILGNLELTSNFKNGLRIVRTEVVCKDYAALVEKVTITNLTKDKVVLDIVDNVKRKKISAKRCKNGNVEMVTGICGEHGAFELGKEKSLQKSLVPKASFTYYNVYLALTDKEQELKININEQIKKRNNFINDAAAYTTLKTPDNNINALYSHCIIRGTESIFKTPAGLLHSPGGGNYYAAIWANDQLEYAAPVAPFLGNKEFTLATQNAINLYINYMDTSSVAFAHKRPLPSSIINGTHPYGVAGDRGDTAMVGLGMAQFLLNNSCADLAREYMWAVDWCIDFCNSRKTADGVISSDSDELEGRFPSGKCNLSTNINYYLLLDCAIVLQTELGNVEKSHEYTVKKEALAQAVSRYFEGIVEGFDTYRYYEKNKELRSWICLPLIAGILHKKQGTISALTTRLYKDGKMLTASGRKTVWDRSLLFALKGIFMAGEPNLAAKYLADYSSQRLLGAHSPYPYEAYPEGNGAHLAGESLLYLRIIIEGMFGIKSVGFDKFVIAPSLPLEGEYKLNKVMLGGRIADITVENGSINVKTADKVYTGTSVLYINF